jgi:hypothetical protein
MVRAMSTSVRLPVPPEGVGTYSEWRPPHLARWLELAWHYQGPTNDRLKRVLPTGRIELLVNFADPYRIVQGGGIEWLASAVLSGVLSRPLILEQPPTTSTCW